MSAPDAAPVTVLSVEPPAVLLDVLRRPRGSALMLGHVHPDGDVLGTIPAVSVVSSPISTSIPTAF